MTTSPSSEPDHAEAFALARRLKTAVWVFDIDRNRIAYANAAACKLWRAKDESELLARDLSDGMSATVANRVRQYQDDFIDRDATFNEFWTFYPQGEPATLKVAYSGFLMPDGRMSMMVEVTGDADEEPATLRSAEALLHTDVMITLYSLDGAPLYSNPAARGAKAGGAQIFAEQFCTASNFTDMEAEWQEHGQSRSVARMKTAKGARWYDLTAKRCLDAATGNQALLVTAVDVSELKTARDTARYLADRDQLTGCYNRAFVTQQLEAISEEVVGTDKSYAVLFMDVDNFKQVNDKFGHEVGDGILKTFANRVRKMIREADILARIGGDEFVVLIEGVRDMDSLHQRLEAIRSEVLKPIVCHGNRLKITTSIGVSIISAENAHNWSDIIKQADIALYSAKRAGRNRHTVFNAALGAEVAQRNWLETELRKAVDNQALSLHFQPRVDMQLRRVVSAEALLRWEHAERGFISPEVFIPISEAVGMIDELGSFVLRRTSEQLSRWREQGLDISLSLNVSPIQFQNPDLVALFSDVAKDIGTLSGGLELEITESSLFGDDEVVYEKINQIRSLGFHFALDDFGTGYSNLGYISKYPFGCIKLDKSFVQMLPSSGPLVRLILTLAKQIGATTVAEGVETAEQFDWLATQGCDQVQGFFFSEAVPEARFLRALGPIEERARGMKAGNAP